VIEAQDDTRWRDIAGRPVGGVADTKVMWAAAGAAEPTTVRVATSRASTAPTGAAVDLIAGTARGGGG